MSFLKRAFSVTKTDIANVNVKSAENNGKDRGVEPSVKFAAREPPRLRLPSGSESGNVVLKGDTSYEVNVL